jgi:isoleucyl-tRNA synthetase
VKTYTSAAGFDPKKAKLKDYEKYLKTEDKWILSRLASLNNLLTEKLESYMPYECVKALDDFVMNDLSRWYIKLIRDRTWVSAEGKDREAAIVTLYTALADISKMMAPFAPFIAEYMHRDLVGGESVFLSGWPEARVKTDEKLEKQMGLVKEIVEQVNAARDEAGIKLRWPVEKIVVDTKEDLKAVSDVICRMTNAKAVEFSGKEPKNAIKKEFSAGIVMLSRDRSQQMVEEGLIRDLLRQIQDMRKKAGLKVSEEIKLRISTDKDFAKVVEKFKETIKSETTSKSVDVSVDKPQTFKTEAKFESRVVWLDYDK